MSPSSPWTAAAVVPFLALVILVTMWGVDVPYWDQWDFAPAVVSIFDGHFTMDMLWRQHADHRLSMTMVVHLALARATHWNTRWELVVNLLVAGGIFVLLVTLLRSSLRRAPFLVAVLSLLVFNLNQWENWLWGWQLHPLLSTLAVLAGFALLAGGRGSGRSTVAAMGLGVVATLSFASGVLYWFAAAPLLLVGPARRWLRLLAWACVTVLALTLFLLSHRPSTVGLEAATSAPRDLLYYACAFVGAPVLSWGGRWCVVAGAAGIGVFAVLVGLVLRGSTALRPREIEHLPACVAVAGYAVGSAVLTGLGRLHFGVGQALSSRYMVVSSLFWAALLAVAWSSVATGDRARTRAVVLASTACLAVLLGVSTLHGGIRMHGERAVRAEAADRLIAGAPAAELAAIYPFPERLGDRIDGLRRHRLSVFRRLPPEGQPESP